MVENQPYIIYDICRVPYLDNAIIYLSKIKLVLLYS